MARDVPFIQLERRSAEDELADRVRQQKAIADLGLRALSGMPVDMLLDDAIRVVIDTLRVDCVGILEALPERDRLLFRAGRGWRDGIVGSSVPSVPGSAAGYILESAEPVVVEDLATETRFERPPILTSHDIRSLCGVVILGSSGRFGILGAHARAPGAFSTHDAAFLQSIANLVGEAISRSRAEDAIRVSFEREREAAERLRSLNDMKNSFLEAVSHELRTPLAAVLGFALTLQEHKDSLAESEADMIMDRLVVNARKLDRLLRDLLDLDRLYRRTIRPSRRPVDVLEIIRSAVAGVDLGGRRLHPPTGSFVANVDGPKVERIVENLAVNCARHTPEGATIWVRLAEAPDGFVIVVEDDGPGVPDHLKTAVFDVFRRGDTSTSHAPGTGIGLSLVRRFAEMHEGRAWVENRPGGGARFCVLLRDEATATGEDASDAPARGHAGAAPLAAGGPRP
ncbi:MAG TPA: ATP-binding protein [Actinomycetota bacterium]